MADEDRWVTAKLEHLVQGELGLAVLNGVFVLTYELALEILDEPGGAERFGAVVRRALADAERLAIPKDVPQEVRGEWRKAAIEAVHYARDYLPEFEE